MIELDRRVPRMTPLVSRSAIFQGTWEEVVALGEKWAGHRVRVLIVEDENPHGEWGIQDPEWGAGTYEEVMKLVQTFSPEENEESLLDAIQENRTMR